MEPGLYRARRPADTPLYALLESLFESVKGAWEDLFESRYGFWRRIVDGVVTRYLDCGIFDRGFACIRCPCCAAEHLLAFSCKVRGLSPSCCSKRAVELLLGPLCTVGWQTVRELIAAAVDDQTFRPGMVAVVQTFGDQLNLHPHVHALVTRGCCTGDGTWLPLPYVSAPAAERLFRHKVLRLLQR